MAKFTVLRRVDAFVDYVTEVEADDAKSAAEAARQEGRFCWSRRGTHTFDARVFVTLDSNGVEIDATEIQDY
jgi:hypothetical protein